MKTNHGLTQYARRALNEKWGYCLGAFGNTLTDALLTQKCSQGNGVGERNTQCKDYLKGFIGRRVSDCYGLIKGYVWTDIIGEILTGRMGEPKYNGAQDRNQEGAYNAAKEKGPLSTLPEIPGLCLWMKGHAGIYLGNGEFIECAGGKPVSKGVINCSIKNGVVTSGSKFTHWFKDTYITYITGDRELVEACIKYGVQMDRQYWEGVGMEISPEWFDYIITGIAYSGGAVAFNELIKLISETRPGNKENEANGE